MQPTSVSIGTYLKIFALFASFAGLYTLHQLLQIGRNSLTPADIRLLLIVMVFGLAGSLLLIFATFSILLSERILGIIRKFRELPMKKAHGYKLAVDTERITHLELVVTSALERMDRRLQALEEKSGEEQNIPYNLDSDEDFLYRIKPFK
jgi:hypothetical protein